MFISTYELVDEICDEERFTKVVTAGLREIRNGVQDGLFTADYPGEDNWAIAHRVLVPAFGPLMIRAMYEGVFFHCAKHYLIIGSLTTYRHVRHCKPACS